MCFSLFTILKQKVVLSFGLINYLTLNPFVAKWNSLNRNTNQKIHLRDTKINTLQVCAFWIVGHLYKKVSLNSERWKQVHHLFFFWNSTNCGHRKVRFSKGQNRHELKFLSILIFWVLTGWIDPVRKLHSAFSQTANMSQSNIDRKQISKVTACIWWCSAYTVNKT